MKRTKLIFLPLVLIFFLSQLNPSPFQKQEKLQEEVTVTAAEIPVRVLHKGQQVKNLTKNDFELYENGVRQEITAFEVISRKMSTQEGIQPQAWHKKKLFILIFNIFDYSDAVGEAIDHFFRSFFTKDCQLIIMVEDRLLNIEREKNLDDLILNLKDTLKKYKQISILNIYRAFDKLNVQAERLQAMLRSGSKAGGSSPYQDILSFYESYLNTWIEYRMQFLSPDLALYETVAERLKRIEGEKWAICFQQREIFPKLKQQSSLENSINEFADSQVDPQAQMNARFIRAKQMQVQRAFDASNSFPAEAMKNLFLDANITFHLVLLRSFRSLGSQDFELREVSKDYEACFRDISHSTGGLSIFSNNLSEALEGVAQKEDYHYLLVYNPKESPDIKKRNIEVKVRKEGVKVIYLKQFSLIRKPAITITNVKHGRKSIKFSIVNCEQIKIEGKLSGIAEIKVTVFDNDSKIVFEEQKTLELIKKDIHISLNFARLKSGNHFIIINVIDKISQRVDVYSSAIKF